MPNHQYTHGGNVFNLAQQLNVSPFDIVDLSSNIAPHTLALVETLLQQYSSYSRFLPEPYSKTLVQSLADYYGFPPECYIVGAGTTELLQWIFYSVRQQTALLIEPTYSDYRKYANLYGLKIRTLQLSETNNFVFQPEVAQTYLSSCQLAVVCNPNNPTGTFIPKSVLQNLFNQFPDILFVVDESYMPFFENHEYSLLDTSFKNVVVLRSLSKIFAIPGLRLGWLFSQNQTLIDKLHQGLSPWNINSIAQKLAEHLITYDTTSIQKELNSIKQDYIKEIGQFSWLHLYPSVTNFVLCRSDRYTSQELFTRCSQQKVLIRDCSNFHGLDHTFIRFAIKQREAMDQFVTILKQLDKSHSKEFS